MTLCLQQTATWGKRTPQDTLTRLRLKTRAVEMGFWLIPTLVFPGVYKLLCLT